MALRLGASTWTCLQACDLRTAMLRLRVVGLSQFNVLTIPPHLWPCELDSAGRRGLRSFLVGEWLTIKSLNLPSTDRNLCSITPQMRAYSISQFEDLIELCGELGTPMRVVVPGCRANFGPPPIADAEGWLRQALDRLVPRAERAGVSLTFEDHHMSLFATVSHMAGFLERFGSERLGIACDAANGEFVGEDQALALRTAGRWSLVAAGSPFGCEPRPVESCALRPRRGRLRRSRRGPDRYGVCRHKHHRGDLRHAGRAHEQSGDAAWSAWLGLTQRQGQG